MGQPKPLLTVAGETFVERAVRILGEGGCEPVIVVVSSDGPAEEISAKATTLGAHVIENPELQAEQIDSLRVGLRAVPWNSRAAVVLPVDHPLVEAETVASLVTAFREREAPIVRPVHDGKPGHPVLFSRNVWPELESPALEHGARQVLDLYRHEIEDVIAGDSGVTVDVDTMEIYDRQVRNR